MDGDVICFGWSAALGSTAWIEKLSMFLSASESDEFAETTIVALAPWASTWPVTAKATEAG